MPDDVLKDEANLIRERRKASADWWNDNYYAEITEVYRGTKCITEPIWVKDPKTGKKKVDKTRTNIAMPDMSRMVRQNTGRMVVNPPHIGYLCEDQAIAAKLSTWRYQQFDRSGEAHVRPLHIQQGEMFGFSVDKTFWGDVVETGKFRKPPDQWDRQMVMEAANSDPQEIEAAMQQHGPKLSPGELQAAVASLGDELQVQEQLKKYEGPRRKFVFIGDYFPEPGFRSIHDSWQIEEYFEGMTWLEKQSKLTYCDEEGTEIPVFNEKAVSELEDKGSYSIDAYEGISTNLRKQLRVAVGQTDVGKYLLNKQLLRGKRFKISECHEEIDGKWWIQWVGNDDTFLGKMPYPHDLRGRSYYTPYVGLPDLLVGIGDSTPRLMRFLYRLRNATTGMTVDLLNQILRRTVFRQRDADLPDEAVERAFYRIIDVKKLSDIQVQQDPDIPAGAFAVGAEIKREIQTLDPAMYSTDSNAGANPGPGRVATTAVLAQRSSDVLFELKLTGLALYDKEIAEKDLLMLQQEMDQPIPLEKKYAKHEAIANLFGDKESKIELKWQDIQYDIGVEPEAGSTLAQDDEFNRMAKERGYQLAMQDPTTWNKNYMAREYAKTMRGVDPAQAVLPETQPPPPPPKVTFSVTAKWEQLPADMKKQLIVGQGVQMTPELSAEIDAQSQIEGATEIGKAAEAVAHLQQPAYEPPVPKSVENRASGSSKKGSTKKSS